MSKPRVDLYTHIYIFAIRLTFANGRSACQQTHRTGTNTRTQTHDHPPALLSSARLPGPNLHYKCTLFNFLRPTALERGHCTPPTALHLLTLVLSLSAAFIFARATTICICICILTGNRRINLRQPHAT